jgi:hypothetical protein
MSYGVRTIHNLSGNVVIHNHTDYALTGSMYVELSGRFTFNSGSNVITFHYTDLLTMAASTEATRVDTGSFICYGGVSVAKNLFVGGSLYLPTGHLNPLPSTNWTSIVYTNTYIGASTNSNVSLEVTSPGGHVSSFHTNGTSYRTPNEVNYDATFSPRILYNDTYYNNSSPNEHIGNNYSPSAYQAVASGHYFTQEVITPAAASPLLGPRMLYCRIYLHMEELISAPSTRLTCNLYDGGIAGTLVNTFPVTVTTSTSILTVPVPFNVRLSNATTYTLQIVNTGTQALDVGTTEDAGATGVFTIDGTPSATLHATVCYRVNSHDAPTRLGVSFLVKAPKGSTFRFNGNSDSSTVLNPNVLDLGTTTLYGTYQYDSLTPAYQATYTMSENVRITSTVDSTNLTTAALVVTGGLSVGKKARIGDVLTLYCATDATKYCTFTVNTSGELAINSIGNVVTFDVTDFVKVLAIKDSTSITTGGLLCSGGASITKNLYVGGYLQVPTGYVNSVATTNNWVSIVYNTDYTSTTTTNFSLEVTSPGGRVSSFHTNGLLKLIPNEVNYNSTYSPRILYNETYTEDSQIGNFLHGPTEYRVVATGSSCYQAVATTTASTMRYCYAYLYMDTSTSMTTSVLTCNVYSGVGTGGTLLNTFPITVGITAGLITIPMPFNVQLPGTAPYSLQIVNGSGRNLNVGCVTDGMGEFGIDGTPVAGVQASIYTSLSTTYSHGCISLLVKAARGSTFKFNGHLATNVAILPNVYDLGTSTLYGTYQYDSLSPTQQALYTMSENVNVSSTMESTGVTVGALLTAGGLAVTKNAYIGGDLRTPTGGVNTLPSTNWVNIVYSTVYAGATSNLSLDVTTPGGHVSSFHIRTYSSFVPHEIAYDATYSARIAYNSTYYENAGTPNIGNVYSATNYKTVISGSSFTQEVTTGAAPILRFCLARMYMQDTNVSTSDLVCNMYEGTVAGTLVNTFIARVSTTAALIIITMPFNVTLLASTMYTLEVLNNSGRNLYVGWNASGSGNFYIGGVLQGDYATVYYSQALVASLAHEGISFLVKAPTGSTYKFNAHNAGNTVNPNVRDTGSATLYGTYAYDSFSPSYTASYTMTEDVSIASRTDITKYSTLSEDIYGNLSVTPIVTNGLLIAPSTRAVTSYQIDSGLSLRTMEKVISDGSMGVSAVDYIANAIFVAPLHREYNALHFSGVAMNSVPTVFGTTSFSNYKLDMATNAVHYLLWNNPPDGGNTMGVRMKYTPNYTVPVARTFYLFSFGASGVWTNNFSIMHNATTDKFFVRLYDSTATVIFNDYPVGVPVWTPVAGTEYDILVNLNVAAGTVAIYIDAVLYGTATFTPATYTRTAATTFLLGGSANAPGSNYSDAWFRDVVVYSTNPAAIAPPVPVLTGGINVMPNGYVKADYLYGTTGDVVTTENIAVACASDATKISTIAEDAYGNMSITPAVTNALTIMPSTRTETSYQIDSGLSKRAMEKINSDGSLSISAVDSIADAIFIAPFHRDLNALYFNGSAMNSVPTISGAAPTFTNDKLDLTPLTTNRFVYWTNPPDGGNIMSVRMKFTPNYSGTPASSVWFFAFGSYGGSNVFSARHDSSAGRFSVTVTNSAGGSLFDGTFAGVWSPVSGTEYDLMFILNTTIGNVKVRESGNDTYDTAITIGTRTASTVFAIGGQYGATSYSNGLFRDVVVYSTSVDPWSAPWTYPVPVLTGGIDMMPNGYVKTDYLYGTNVTTEDIAVTSTSYHMDSGLSKRAMDKVSSDGSLSVSAVDSITNAVFIAPLHRDYNALHFSGTTMNSMPSTYGTVTITNYKLNLSTSGVHNVYWANPPDQGNLMGIRFKYTPNYTTVPTSEAQLFMFSNGVYGNGANYFYITHRTGSGGFEVHIDDEVDASIYSGTLAAWNPSSGVEYDFLVNLDVTTGTLVMYINGAVHASASFTGGKTRTATTNFGIGGVADWAANSEGYFRDVVIYSTNPDPTGWTYPLPVLTGGINMMPNGYVKTDYLTGTTSNVITLSSPVWEDMDILPTVRMDPVNTPSMQILWPTASGRPDVYQLAFATGVVNAVYFNFKMPRAWQTTGEFKIYARLSTAAIAGTSRWILYYGYEDPEGGAMSWTESFKTVTAPVTTKQIMSVLFARTNNCYKQMTVQGMLYRDGADAGNDTIADNVFLVGFYVSYEVDKVMGNGSL